MAHEPELRQQDFAIKLTQPLVPGAMNGSAAVSGSLTLDEVEKAHILRVLEECSYNQTRTADVLGIDRATLHNKLRKYGWNRPLVEAR